MEPRWLRLYKQGTQKQLNRNKDIKYVDKQCTFKPKINKNYKIINKDNVFTRLYNNDKEKQITKNIKSNKTDCTFKPNINKKSIYLTRHRTGSVFDRLYKR